MGNGFKPSETPYRKSLGYKISVTYHATRETSEFQRGAPHLGYPFRESTGSAALSSVMASQPRDDWSQLTVPVRLQMMLW